MSRPETLTVKAVKGVVCPYPGIPGRFVGYRKMSEEDSEPADHVVPDGYSYVIAAPVTVPNNRHWRRMVKQNAVEKVDTHPPVQNSDPPVQPKPKTTKVKSAYMGEDKE